MGNRITVRRLTVALFAIALTGALQPHAGAAPSVQASSSIVIDASDGRVLFEHAADQRRAIASTTKILTALVVLERAKLTDMVQASERAERVGADDPLVTELELTAGERLSVHHLLYGLMLRSANDAAVALAEHIGGSESAFAEMMNQRAKRAGAARSSFVNPHGFDHPDHYSTARDLALIAREALRIEEFRRIVSTTHYEIPWSARGSSRVLRNRNQLLGSYPGADGVKTGQTRASGRSLVASATRGQEQRISVVLASPDPVAESATLLDFGFDNFERKQLVSKGTAWGYVTAGSGQSQAIVPRSSLSFLVEKGKAPPTAEFRTKDHVLVVEVPGTKPIRVSTSLTCVDPCPTTNRGVITNVLTFITSVIRWL